MNNFHATLFDSDDDVFALLDGANIDQLLDKLYQLKPEFYCLQKGKHAPDMAEVLPYLVKLEKQHPFTKWIITSGVGKSWGSFLRSSLETKKLLYVLRKKTNVETMEGKVVFFRYYDPRVLRVLLPVCNEEELKYWLEDVGVWFIEDDNAETVSMYRCRNGNLFVDSIAI